MQSTSKFDPQGSLSGADLKKSCGYTLLDIISSDIRRVYHAFVPEAWSECVCRSLQEQAILTHQKGETKIVEEPSENRIQI